MKKTYKPLFRCKEYAKLLKEETKPIIFYDLETIGTSKSSFVVQISGFKFVKKEKGYVYSGEKINLYIKPPIPMPKGASEANHITNEMLVNCPSEEEVFPIIEAFFGDISQSIVSGYNIIRFDNNLMNEMYLRNKGITFSPFASIDVMLMARELLERENLKDNTFTLSSIGEYFGFLEDNMHSSDVDTKVTIKALKALLEKYKKTEIPNYKTRPKLKVANTSVLKKGKTANFIMIYVTGIINEELITGHLHYDKWNYRFVEDVGDLFNCFDMEQLVKDTENATGVK